MASGFIDPSVGDFGDFLSPYIDPTVDLGFFDSETGTNVSDQIQGTSNDGIDGLLNCGYDSFGVGIPCGDGSTTPSDPIGVAGPLAPIDEGFGLCLDPYTFTPVTCPGDILVSDGVTGTTASGAAGGGTQGGCLPGGATGPCVGANCIPCSQLPAGDNPTSGSTGGASSSNALSQLGGFLGNLLRGITGNGALGSGVIPACGSGFSSSGLCRATNGTLYRQGPNGTLVAATGAATTAGFLGNSGIIVAGGLIVLLVLAKAKGKL